MNRVDQDSDSQRRIERVIAAFFLLALLSGCQQQQTNSRRPPYLDAQTASVDRESPYTMFDGRGGSLLLTDGWGNREGDDGSSEIGSFSWSVADEVKMRFQAPVSRDYDFYARVNPYLRPGPVGQKPLPQTMTFSLEGEPAASLTLSAGWQPIRVPLPRLPADRRLLELKIRFAYTTSPKSLGDGLDARQLGVAFTEAAIVPRDVQDARTYVASLPERLQSDGVTVDARTPWVTPLPVGAQVVFALSHVETDCANCVLTAALQTPAGELDPLWSGTVDGAAMRDITVTTAGEGISTLRISLDADCPGCSPDAQAKLILGGDFLSSTPSRGSSKRPHVFIYTIDTLRADALEPYGAATGSSPEIAKFANNAVVYANARAASSWTLPSTVSLLTGVHADRHQVMKGDLRFSEKQASSLPRLLAEEGYETVGISQSYVVSADFGLDEPFDSFFLNDHLNSFALRSQRVRRFLLEWLSSQGGGASPIFAYMHTVDPHAPYEPTGLYRQAADANPGKLDTMDYLPTVFRQNGHLEDAAEVRHLKALYAGEVLYADTEFGQFIALLQYLNLYDDSLIVLVSDHGEEFGEHGGVDHGRTVYDEMLRVPLIVKYPHQAGAGLRIEPPVSTVDVAPTVLELAGIETKGLDLDGRTLPLSSPSAAGGIVFARLEVDAGTTSAAVNQSAYIRDSLKCIHSPSGRDRYRNEIPVWQAFDLSSDPAEMRLADAAPCEDLAAAWDRDRSDAIVESEKDEVSEESLKRLRSLGYIQ